MQYRILTRRAQRFRRERKGLGGFAIERFAIASGLSVEHGLSAKPMWRRHPRRRTFQGRSGFPTASIEDSRLLSREAERISLLRRAFRPPATARAPSPLPLRSYLNRKSITNPIPCFQCVPWLFTTHYPLPTTNYSLPSTNYPLLHSQPLEKTHNAAYQISRFRSFRRRVPVCFRQRALVCGTGRKARPYSLRTNGSSSPWCEYTSWRR